MSIKAKLEALIYAAEEPITPDQMAALLKDDLLALKTAVLQPGGKDQPEEVKNGGAPVTKRAQQKSERAELRELLRPFLEELIADSSREDRGIEVRQVAGGYRMSTKPEHHDVVRTFAKSLKPPVRLSLPALETLAVIAYKQPVTVPEINEIRGVDASAVIGTLLDRKLITTAGRKAVVGRPMLYKTSKDFLLRFGLKDLSELPSLEEFEKLAAGELLENAGAEAAMTDATGVSENRGAEQLSDDQSGIAENVTEPTVSSDPHHDETDDEAADQIASESSGG